MSDDLQAWLRERADASLPSVGSKLRCAAQRLDDQQSEIAELRRLLRIAVDAWDRVDETVAWLEDDEWFAMAKELIAGKDGEA